MSTDAARQPKGVPAGGQFAATEHPESGVALAGTPEWESWLEVFDVRAALAETLGCDPALVRTTADTSRRCGSPDGSAWVVLEADLPGDALNQDVRVAFSRYSDGGTMDEMSCTVSWDVEPFGAKYTFGPTRGSVSSKSGPGDIHQMVNDTLDQARMQRAADRVVNRPQIDKLLANKRKDWGDYLQYRVTAGGAEPVVSIVDHRNDRADQIEFRLHRATGQIIDAVVETGFGSMVLVGDNLDKAARQVDMQTRMVLGQYDELAGSSRDSLEVRLAEIVNG